VRSFQKQRPCGHVVAVVLALHGRCTQTFKDAVQTQSPVHVFAVMSWHDFSRQPPVEVRAQRVRSQVEALRDPQGRSMHWLLTIWHFCAGHAPMAPRMAHVRALQVFDSRFHKHSGVLHETLVV
jgi:hypothetical protein